MTKFIAQDRKLINIWIKFLPARVEIIYFINNYNIKKAQ